jgi:hypothetical protein
VKPQVSQEGKKCSVGLKVVDIGHKPNCLKTQAFRKIDNTYSPNILVLIQK